MSVQKILIAGDDLDVVNAARNKTIGATRLAFLKGYRATGDGRIITPDGKVLLVRRRGSQRYATFGVYLGKVDGKYTMLSVPVHRFAAYCFFGEEALRAGVHIRHLNADRDDFSRSNLAIGTPRQNEMDKPSSVRSASARAARAAQGSRALNARFSPEQVREIRQRYAGSETGAQIARAFGVTRECIHRIVKRVNYSDI